MGVGVLVAVLSYFWITDPTPRMERVLQDAAVSSARAHLKYHVDPYLEFVDPGSPDRTVGKSYVFRAGDGWEVSGYYRRDENDSWHPFLMTLDAENAMTHLRVEDPALAGNSDPSIEVLP